MARHFSLHASALTVALTIAAAVVAGCASNPGRTGVTDDNLDSSIQQARSETDHTAIAEYYDQRALEAQRDLRVRREARRHYAHEPPGVYYPTGTTSGMLEHYDRLIAGYEQTMHENHELAAWHRRMAREAADGHPQ